MSLYQVQVWNGIIRVGWKLRPFPLLSCAAGRMLYFDVCVSCFYQKKHFCFILSVLSRSDEVGRRLTESRCWTLVFSCSRSAADPYCVKQSSPATGSNLVPIQIHMGPRFCKRKGFWYNLPPSPSLQLLCWGVVFGNHQNAACLCIIKHWGHCDRRFFNSRIRQYADSKELGKW